MSAVPCRTGKTSMRILRRYVFGELVGPFFLGLAIFTFILFIGVMRDLAEMIVQVGGGLLRLVPYVPLFSLSYSLPMAMLTATLLAMSRLSSENEVTAIRSCGISPVQVLMPALCAALVLSVLSLKLNGQIVPSARHSYEQLLRHVGVRKPEVIFREGTLIEDFEQCSIFIGKRKDDRLFDVLISRESASGYKTTIKAETALLTIDDEIRLAEMELFRGFITTPGADPTDTDETEFKSYRIKFLLPALPSTEVKRTQEMTDEELKDEIQDYRKKGLPSTMLEMELQERWSLAFASFAFVMVSGPLALRLKRGGKSAGFGLSIFVMVAYYLLLTAGEAMGERGIVPPAAAMWMPNVVLGLTGSALLIRTVRR